MATLRSISGAVLAIGLTVVAAAPGALAEEWESTVTPFAPGTFPELRPATAKYSFGWNGMTAAAAEVRFTKSANGRSQFDISGGTIGLVRSLWDYEVKHTALADAETLRPIKVHEVEKVRSKRLTTDLTFTPEGVTSQREERKDSTVKSKTRKFDFSNVLSLNSALLFLRTQSLPDGASQRIVVYPATSAYLCTVKVLGRERISVPTGSYDAIKIGLQLNKIGKKRELLPHKKFRRAIVWMSDDRDRLVLKIEAKIFVGTVFAELQSVQFGSAGQ